MPWREANVHVLTHALHYASSVFEGQRAYGGEIFKLTEHSERLRKSAELLGFEIPWRVEEIDAACREVLAANGLEDAYMRPLAWRGSEQMGVSAQRSRDPPRHRLLGLGRLFRRGGGPQGLKLDISPWRRPAPLYRADREQGGRPLHDLHAGPARGRRPRAMTTP